MSVAILRGDAAALPLPDGCVDLVVTSPPYFGLRSYQDSCAACADLRSLGHDPHEAFPDWDAHVQGFHHYAGQIGSEATPREFLDALLAATAEMVRVLKPSGSIWVNLGDKYVSPGGHTGMPTKSLMGLPWRYAIRCIDDLGLILRAEVVWSKPNGLPESVTDRVRRSHEQWFHFTVQPRYYSAVDAIREPIKPGQSPSALSFSRSGRGTAPGQSCAPHREGRAAQGAHPLGALPGSVWSVPTQPLKVPAELGVDHFAAFPMEWPRRIITGWCPRDVCTACGEGRRPVVASEYVKLWNHEPKRTAANPDNTLETFSAKGRGYNVRDITGWECACLTPDAPSTPGVVLDPFGGTGTTAMVAAALGCHGISLDHSGDYCRLAAWRSTDPVEVAKAMQVERPPAQDHGTADLLGLIGEAS